MSSLAPSSPNLSSNGIFSPDLSSTSASSPDLSQSVSSPISSSESSCNLNETINSTIETATTPPPQSPPRPPHFLQVDATPKNGLATKNLPPSPPRSAPPARLCFSPATSGIAFRAAYASRTRANSLTSGSLAERRRSKTSAYLSSEDFKQDFASKLRSVKARERSERTKPALSVPSLIDDVPSMTRPFESDSSFGRDRSQDKLLGLTALNVPPRKDQLREIIDRLLVLPPKELAVQLEIQFSRLERGRDAEELEARNEVISTLADQLANQLEAKEKILCDLECLRSAHASLCAELADAREEIACREAAANRAPLRNEELAQLRLESEAQIRHLRHALKESKQALSSLRYDQARQDRRQSLQSHHSTFNSLLSSAPVQKRSSVSILGTDRDPVHCNKRSSTGSAGSELSGATNFPERASWRAPNELPITRRSSLFSIFANPTRPPKTQAHSGSSSHVITEEPSEMSSHQEELESLRLQCNQLKIKLKESEDSRLASQAALDALKTFISSSSQMEVSSVKLPPLPTEMQSLDSKPRWGLLGRSSMVNPPSPNAAATFSEFLWGKKPRESNETEGR